MWVANWLQSGGLGRGPKPNSKLNNFTAPQSFFLCTAMTSQPPAWWMDTGRQPPFNSAPFAQSTTTTTTTCQESVNSAQPNQHLLDPTPRNIRIPSQFVPSLYFSAVSQSLPSPISPCLHSLSASIRFSVITLICSFLRSCQSQILESIISPSRPKTRLFSRHGTSKQLPQTPGIQIIISFTRPLYINPVRTSCPSRCFPSSTRYPAKKKKAIITPCGNPPGGPSEPWQASFRLPALFPHRCGISSPDPLPLSVQAMGQPSASPGLLV
ncbi:hypothetical protein V8F06_010689 [Rhypophila decipiens]